jgi:hypothetical protein
VTIWWDAWMEQDVRGLCRQVLLVRGRGWSVAHRHVRRDHSGITHRGRAPAASCGGSPHTT